MVEKPEAMYGEIQGVVGYWYHEMDMDMWLKPILKKAEKWEQYAIYDNEKDAEIPVKDLIVAYERLEAVKTWYNKNKPDLYALLTKGAWSELCKILEAEG